MGSDSESSVENEDKDEELETMTEKTQKVATKPVRNCFNFTFVLLLFIKNLIIDAKCKIFGLSGRR